MKYIYQFSVILLVSALGELLRLFIPLPVPASIYGLILMLAALITGVIKLEKVEAAADFLLDIMAIAFIPGGVALITAWDSLKGMLVPALVITVVTTVFVIGATGSITQLLIKAGKRVKRNDCDK